MRRAVVFLALLAMWAVPATAESLSCAEWLQFSPKEHVVAMAAFLEQALPKGLPDSTVSCLQSIVGQIALHSVELCKRDGGDFVPAGTTAIYTAIQYCDEREKRKSKPVPSADAGQQGLAADNRKLDIPEFGSVLASELLWHGR